MRYVNLSSILAFTKIACKVQQRFPSYESLVEAKLLLPHEVCGVCIVFYDTGIVLGQL